jgi:uncharacterized repeat protein (TIGR01451 family)
LPNDTAITNTAWISDDLSTPLVLTARTLLRSPDLSISEKTVNVASAFRGDVVTYTILIRNTAEVTASVRLTDVLPGELDYVPDSLWASSGAPIYHGGTITWQGAVVGKGLALLRFAARVTQAARPDSQIINEALIQPGVAAALRRSASLAVLSRAYHGHLPLLMKQQAR